ncbi:MAG TPA: hypothetical protein VGQ37_12910 [Vicinamibacterales bacterium]|jgi:hypothetical protein|nr:hypothetical protein [Vicinamibacterales bacterium]
MPAAKFVKDNLVLVVGLTLPVLLMAGFLAVSALPDRLSDPPQYDLVFTTNEYPSTPVPINVRLIVKDGALVAQYTRPPGQQGSFGVWKKLFVYEASARRVRQLTFGFPTDMATLDGTREEPVASAAQFKLDTTLQSPDGYELAYGDRRGGGLLLELFGGARGYEPRLRKGSRSVPLTAAVGQPAFDYGGVEFVGWVTARNLARLRLATAAFDCLPSGQALP